MRLCPREGSSAASSCRAAADAIELQGQPYCFPHSVHTLALLYNADLFEQAGVQPPSSAWTWQDLAAAAAALTNPDDGIVGMVLDPSPQTWIPFYVQAGGALEVDEQGSTSFATAPAETASEYVAALFAQGAARTPAMLGKSWTGEAFAAGEVGMTIAGDWILPYLDANPPPFAYATTELPGGPAGRGNVAFANCLAVNANSANLDLAQQLAAQLTAPEVLSKWSAGDADALSVYITDDVVTELGQAHLDPFLRSLRYATPWRQGQFAADYGDIFAEGIEMVYEEELTPDEFWPYLLRRGVNASPR